ncbi:pyruvate kinase [Planctomycetaceae bacterium SH139]
MPRPNLGEANTKIVCTVGPACDTVEKLVTLIEHGADIFRINSAHGNRESHERILAAIREAAVLTGYQVGVLLDLAGPKLRLGTLLTDPLPCEVGMELTFVRGDVATESHELTSAYTRLIDELKVGNRVMLADGTVALEVTAVTPDRAHCRVTGGGEIRSRQGINLPGVALSVSSMRPSDVDNAIWGAKVGIDFISLSFVRSAEDVRSLKNLLTSYESHALVVAKIEKREALDDLEAIVDAADGVMVARGDLGVEIDVAETPVAQKRIIRVCREKLKPVIVATQMLESMHHNRRPTRAEASDVANAILDGADACMLSGETAIGDYPVEAVDTMNRIMIHTERELMHNVLQVSRGEIKRVHAVTSAVAFGATSIAEAIQAKMIVIATRSGGTAWVKSNQRSLIPTIGASDNEETLRRMTIFWGIKPCRVRQLDDGDELFAEISRGAWENGLAKPGDRIVFVTGNSVLHNAHNLLVVHSVTPESCRSA